MCVCLLLFTCVFRSVRFGSHGVVQDEKEQREKAQKKKEKEEAEAKKKEKEKDKDKAAVVKKS